MFKYKKICIIFITFVYIILTLIELVEYLFIRSNLFGLIYLMLSIFIIFLLIPLAYNYKRHYSKERISKLIIIIIIGLFDSYLLYNILINNMNYMDSSKQFNDTVFIIKNIIKPIMYFIIFIFTVIESKILNKFSKRLVK